jgi:hypothetical protein
LLQHAFQKIAWLPWSEAAFIAAESQQKLILVSIGYSACHWCHVMAETTFEDEACIEFMNQHFICIKVDREEHIDVDHYYMEACQLMNGNGGWPLNAICLPDKRPLQVSTYSNAEQWIKMITQIQQIWEHESHKAYAFAERLAHGIQEALLPPQTSQHETAFNQDWISKCIAQIDLDYGGLKGAPKFPMPSLWKALLLSSTANDETANLCQLTLDKMCMGAIYDVIEGGFSRYSVDAYWHIPHFEKMLYDNAQLISLYALAFQRFKDEKYAQIAQQSLAFVEQNWRNSDGLFYASTDADSEHQEGLYYTHSLQTLNEVLGEQAAWFCRYHHCSNEGNFEHGRNALYRIETLQAFCQQEQLDYEHSKNILNDCYSKLKQHKSTLTKPSIDFKSVLHWNALMVNAYCMMAMTLKAEKYKLSAVSLMQQINAQFNQDGEWYRVYSQGRVMVKAYFEDLAALIDANIQLYQISFDEKYLQNAKTLCEQCIAAHYDAETGFFSNQQDALLPIFPITDDITSSGNSVMAHNLYILSWYFDQSNWRAMAHKMLMNMSPLIERSAPWFAHWALLSECFNQGFEQAVFASATMPVITPDFLFNRGLGWASPNTIIPLFKGKTINHFTQLYTCINSTCLLPIPLDADAMSAFR